MDVMFLHMLSSHVDHALTQCRCHWCGMGLAQNERAIELFDAEGEMVDVFGP